MNRTQYRQARRLLRDNGNYALRWMESKTADLMAALVFGQKKDRLAERAWIIDWAKRDGFKVTPRQTA